MLHNYRGVEWSVRQTRPLQQREVWGPGSGLRIPEPDCDITGKCAWPSSSNSIETVSSTVKLRDKNNRRYKIHTLLITCECCIVVYTEKIDRGEGSSTEADWPVKQRSRWQNTTAVQCQKRTGIYFFCFMSFKKCCKTNVHWF